MLNKTLGILAASIFVFAACNPGQINTETDPPEVISVNPPDGASSVPLDTRIQVEFSEKIPEGTIQRDRFVVAFAELDSLEQGTYEVEGATATFIPRDSLLESNVRYRVTVDSVADLNGNKMQGQREWEFTTEDIPPAVESVSPAEGATGVSVGSDIRLVYSEEIEPNTVNQENFQVTYGDENTVQPGTYSASGDTAIFTPEGDTLEDAATYRVSVEDVEDRTGNPMTQPREWEFTTEDLPPTVESFSPAEGASDVPLDSDVSVTFTEEINPNTVNEENFQVTFGESDSLEQGSYSVEGSTAIFSPSDSQLESDTTYQVTLDNIEDTDGSSIPEQVQWEFTTTGSQNKIRFR